MNRNPGRDPRTEGWDPIQGQKARMGSTDRARIGIQGQKAKVGSTDRARIGIQGQKAKVGSKDRL